MGYHRPIDHFNPGKQQEAEDRKYFAEPDDGKLRRPSLDTKRTVPGSVGSCPCGDGNDDYLRYSGKL